MDEQTRSMYLQQQQAQTCGGTITYEHGLTIETISGMLKGTGSGFIVFGDPCALMIEQQRTYIPEHRIISVSFEA